MAVPPCVSTVDASSRQTPEQRNWLVLWRATSIFCEGIRPFIEKEIKLFHTIIHTKLAGAMPCNCAHVARRKPNPYHDTAKCSWANLLNTHHRSLKPNWKQSDSTKWKDLSNGSWEIAKLFMPDLGHQASTIISADMTDISGLLNVMYWCNHFKIPQATIADLRDIRNSKLVHIPKLEVTEGDKKTAFAALKKLLQDPELVHDLSAQDALKEITSLEGIAHMGNIEVNVLAEFQDVLEKEVKEIKRKLINVERDKRKNDKSRRHLQGQLRNMKNTITEVERRSKASRSIVWVNGSKTFHAVICYLVCGIKSTRNGLLAACVIVLILLCCAAPLDRNVYRDGCPMENSIIPFDTREFNLTDYLETAREHFIGRRWLYHELELYFSERKNDTVQGTLIIGQPGSGKSALASQLICSRTSSSFIHEKILGYHLCKYSDKNTQTAGKFVRNIVEMIARRIPEYGVLIANSSFIQRTLDRDCIHDPVGCFEQAVLIPLRGLSNTPKHDWYIIIDGLDECCGVTRTSHDIVYLIQTKLTRFPEWLKLIMTSRNDTSILSHMSSIRHLPLTANDKRNLDDIELFLTTQFFKNSYYFDFVKLLYGQDTVEQTNVVIATLLNNSQGNFLFVKEMLHYWRTSSNAQRRPYALPKSIGDIYNSYFERLYGTETSYRPVRRILEILVSTFTPMTVQDVYDVIHFQEPTLESDYEYKDSLKDLSHFTRYSENNTVSLYHLSLIEWLTGDAKGGPYYVSKRIGHKVLSEYYSYKMKESDIGNATKYIFLLAQHVAFGGWKKEYIEGFLKIPSTTVNSTLDSTNQTLLHLAATINNSDVLWLLLPHFSCIDCEDSRGFTPAFLAAVYGFVDNVELLVERGARVNHKTKPVQDCNLVLHSGQGDGKAYSVDCSDMDNIVLKAKSTYRGFTMLHAASQNNHMSVVKFLLANNAFVSSMNSVHLTALHVAAEAGHVNIVKLLYEEGAAVDQEALYHAAVNGRVDVVRLLLNVGIKDSCLRCDDSFYWLDESQRLQSPKIYSIFIPIENITQHDGILRNVNPLYQWDVIENIEWKRAKPVVIERKLFDDKHRIYCETALHSATSEGHIEVVKVLISQNQTALGCKDFAGRTTLHEAIRRGRHRIVQILLEAGADVNAKCYQRQHLNVTQIESYLSREEADAYSADGCLCGNTPLHLAARYGRFYSALELIKRGADIDARDCTGATPLHIAACHSQRNMTILLTHKNIGADINCTAVNGSTPLHSAAACSATDIMSYLISLHKANINAVDKYGLTPLFYIILRINPQPLYETFLVNDTQNKKVWNEVFQIDRKGKLAKYYVVTNASGNQIKNTHYYRWLDALLAFVSLTGRKNLDVADFRGRTVLHLAASQGLADAVNVLLQSGAYVDAHDKSGKTPLDLAIDDADKNVQDQHIIIVDEFDKLNNHLQDHSMVVHLLLSYGASFKKCERGNNSLIVRAIKNHQVYSLQALLLKGARLNCKHRKGMSPLLLYLQYGGKMTDMVLKYFNTSVSITCGEPFEKSELHLLAYRKPSKREDNLFQTHICNEDPPKCGIEDGPLLKAIKSHPQQFLLLDSCLDAEGYTPLHRAIQGANIVAIGIFLAYGADVSIPTPDGYDSIMFSVFNAQDELSLHSNECLFSKIYGKIKHTPPILSCTQEVTHSEISEVTIKLLRHVQRSKPAGYKVNCSPDKAELTLYHLAAATGLPDLVEYLIKHRKVDVNCRDKHGITPLYLARLYGSHARVDFGRWRKVIDLIESYGGEMQYPESEMERYLIYRYFTGDVAKNQQVSTLSRRILKTVTRIRNEKNISFDCRSYFHNNTYHDLLLDAYKVMNSSQINREFTVQLNETNKKLAKSNSQLQNVINQIKFNEDDYIDDSQLQSMIDVIHISFAVWTTSVRIKDIGRALDKVNRTGTISFENADLLFLMYKREAEGFQQMSKKYIDLQKMKVDILLNYSNHLPDGNETYILYNTDVQHLIKNLSSLAESHMNDVVEPIRQVLNNYIKNSFSLNDIEKQFNITVNLTTSFYNLISKYSHVLTKVDKLNAMIKSYDRNTSLWHINALCFFYNRHWKYDLFQTKPMPRIFVTKPSLFVMSRMRWHSRDLENLSWPLDFLLKLYSGHYSSFRYVEVLHGNTRNEQTKTNHQDHFGFQFLDSVQNILLSGLSNKEL